METTVDGLKELFRDVIKEEFGPMKPILCKFALELVDAVPDYFWTEAASASGLHHPAFGLGEGGLARHSLMVYRWLKILMEANEQDMSEFMPGMVLASLFHDCCKRGMPDNIDLEHTKFEHPFLSAKFVLDKAEQFAKDNKSIGMFNLDGIPMAPRGVPQIEVTFDIDANGILNVTAKDKGTGKEQHITITASSGLSKEEIERMKAEAAANEAADKAEREKVDKINQADSMIFQVEKQLKESGDKIPADMKQRIEDILGRLKTAKDAKDIAGIDAATNELQQMMGQAAQNMYGQQGPNPGAGQQGGFNGGQQNNNGAEDVDFEEVK